MLNNTVTLVQMYKSTVLFDDNNYPNSDDDNSDLDYNNDNRTIIMMIIDYNSMIILLC